MYRQSRAQILIDDALNADLSFDSHHEPALILDSLSGLPASCSLLSDSASNSSVSRFDHGVDHLRFSVGSDRTTKFFSSPCVLCHSTKLSKVHLVTGELGTWQRIYGKTYIEIELQSEVGQWLTSIVKEYAEHKKVDLCWKAYNHEIVCILGGRAFVEVNLPGNDNSDSEITVSYGNKIMTLSKMMTKANRDVVGVGVFTCSIVRYRSWHAEREQRVLRITLAGFRYLSDNVDWLRSTSRVDLGRMRHVISGHPQSSGFVQLLTDSMRHVSALVSYKRQIEEEEEEEEKEEEKRQHKARDDAEETRSAKRTRML